MDAFKKLLHLLLGPCGLIHRQAGPDLLQAARWGIFSLWIFKLLLDPLWRLSALPLDLYQSIGLLEFLSSSSRAALFSATGLTVLWSATELVCLLALWPRAFIFAAPLAALLLTIYSTVIRAYGTAFHTDLSLLYSTYALALFALADFFSVGQQPRPKVWNSYPLVTIVALLALTYSLVAVNRLVGGGLEVFTSATMEIWTIDASLRGYYFDTGLGWHVPEIYGAATALQIGLFFTTLLELLAPLCLFYARFRWIFILYMLVFHGLSLLFLNIFFFDNILLFLLLIDWSNPAPAPLPSFSRAHSEVAQP